MGYLFYFIGLVDIKNKFSIGSDSEDKNYDQLLYKKKLSLI